MVTKVSFHAMIQNFLFMRLKDSSMVYAPGFEQFSQGFHIMQILDIEKNLGFAFLKIDEFAVHQKLFSCIYMNIICVCIFSNCWKA